MAHTAPDDRRGDLGLFDHYLGKKGTKIQVYKKVLEIEAGIKLDKSKTIGTITTKNSGKILMSAHSGYTSGSKREDHCLDTFKWNELAYHIAKQIKFKFAKNIRDNAGHPILPHQVGRAHAGHVEVLLGCWFVLHLLRGEPELADESERNLISQLKRLRNKDLGDLRTAFVTIDSEPCRTCLVFLNKLSQYTGICFVIFGSRGVGPIQVRIEGQRRLDIVGDVFSGSEDEPLYQEAREQAEEVVDELPTEDAAVPVTPVQRPILRRPQSSWRAAQWTPENPDELLSSYKKKTPVFEFPGYDGNSFQNSVTADEYWTIHSPSVHVQPTSTRPVLSVSIEEGEAVEDDEWVDVGEGILMCRKNALNKTIENKPVKSEHSAAYASGSHYARAAYDAIEEMEYEVVERPDHARQYSHNRQTVPSTNILRRLAPVDALRIQRFRHRPVEYNDESVFKSRYSILNPRRRR